MSRGVCRSSRVSGDTDTREKRSRSRSKSRDQRSGRYAPPPDGKREHPERLKKRSRSKDKERDHDRQKDGKERHSSEGGKKRRSNDGSDDEPDVDHPDQNDKKPKPDEKSNAIAMVDVPLSVKETDIRYLLKQLSGPKPVNIRLLVMVIKGRSRGCALVEFGGLEDAAQWMEINQNKVVIQGAPVELQYSSWNQQAGKKWHCIDCGWSNVKKCSECRPKTDEKESSAQRVIHLGNLSFLSTVTGIFNVLSSYCAYLTKSNIHLLKDPQTGLNTGFAVVQLPSHEEASMLLNHIKSMEPPLKLHGKTITVNYLNSSEEDPALPDGVKACPSPASVAAIAAQSSSGQKLTPAATGVVISKPPQLYQPAVISRPAAPSQVQQQQYVGSAAVVGGGSLGAPPEMKTSTPPATDVVISKPPQLYPPPVISQPAAPHQVQQQQHVGSVPVSFGAPPEVKTLTSPGTSVVISNSLHLHPPPVISQPAAPYPAQQHEGFPPVFGGGSFGAAPPGIRTWNPAGPGVFIPYSHHFLPPDVFSHPAAPYHVRQQFVGSDPVFGGGPFRAMRTWTPAGPEVLIPNSHHLYPPHVLSQPDAPFQVQQLQHEGLPPVFGGGSLREMSTLTPTATGVVIPNSHHFYPPPVLSQPAPPHQVQQQQQLKYEGSATVAGAPPGMKTLAPAATGVVASTSHQLHQPAVESHPSARPNDASQQATRVCTASPATTAASTVETTVRAASSANTRVIGTDNSTYQFDEESGYYCNAKTGIYYDPSSHYYFKLKTKEYLYWDIEKQVYVPIQPEESGEEAKALDKSPDESVPCAADNNAEEGGSSERVRLGNITDWKNLICLLCNREFATKMSLQQHQKKSELHKKNMDNWQSECIRRQLERRDRKKYIDRASERGEKCGVSEPIDLKQREDDVANDRTSMRYKMLKDMGWLVGLEAPAGNDN